MLKVFFEPMDRIKPTDDDIERYIQAVLNAKSNKKILNPKPEKRHKKFALISAVAASLAVIIALGVFLIPKPTVSDNKTQSNDYSFTLTANAAEIKDKNLGSNIIGAFEGGSSYGAYLKGQEGYGKQPDWFQQFELTSFAIEGKNIKSVTISSKTKGVYFNVTPIPKIIKGDISTYNPDQGGILLTLGGRSVWATNYKNEDEYNAAQKAEKKKYSDTDRLTNSRYTLKQLTGASYSGFFADYVCDSFTYNNTDKKSVINLDYVIELTVESIQTDDNKVGDYLKRINELAENENNYTVGVGNDDSFEKDKLLNNILTTIIKDATIDVTVNYDNGKSKSKSFKLGSYQEEEWFTWLTLSEE